MCLAVADLGHGCRCEGGLASIVGHACAGGGIASGQHGGAVCALLQHIGHEENTRLAGIAYEKAAQKKRLAELAKAEKLEKRKRQRLDAKFARVPLDDVLAAAAARVAAESNPKKSAKPKSKGKAKARGKSPARKGGSGDEGDQDDDEDKS